MKKIFLSMAVIASTMMVACGNKGEQNATDADSIVGVEEVVEEEVVVDEAQAPVSESEAASVLDNIKNAASKENVQKGLAYVQSLISSGKLTEAKSYLEQVKPYADKVGMSSAITTIENTLSQAENLTGGAKAAADQAVSDAKDKAETAVNDAKDKANAAATNAVNDAKEKAANAVGGLLK